MIWDILSIPVSQYFWYSFDLIDSSLKEGRGLVNKCSHPTPGEAPEPGGGEKDA